MGWETKRNVSNVKYFILSYIYIIFRSIPTIKIVKFVIPNFVNFSSGDLEWLKNDNRWLSDSHITLTLLWVHFFFNSFIT